MSDLWQFWRDEIAGLNPETTPGTPHAGYYLARRRESFPNPNPGVGQPRRKVVTYHDPVAIWHDESGWHCLITREGSTPVYLTDVEQTDQLFSRCCREAITYSKYIELVPEQEQVA